MAWHFTDISAAEAAYDDLKRKIENGNANLSEAYSLLNQIITDFPGTWLAGLAKQLRDEL